MTDNGGLPPQQMKQVGPFGSRFQVAPVDWDWLRLQALRSDGVSEQIHVLRLHTMVGVVGIPFTKEALTRFIATAKIEVSGLHLPPQ